MNGESNSVEEMLQVAQQRLSGPVPSVMHPICSFLQQNSGISTLFLGAPNIRPVLAIPAQTSEVSRSPCAMVKGILQVRAFIEFKH